MNDARNTTSPAPEMTTAQAIDSMFQMWSAMNEHMTRTMVGASSEQIHQAVCSELNRRLGFAQEARS
jgi:hypothetical protein